VSGVRSYDIFAAEDDTPFAIWKENVTTTAAIFNGKSGHEYAFYPICCDNAGNREEAPALANMTRVKVDMVPPEVSVRVGSPSSGYAPVFVYATTPILIEGVDDFAGVKNIFFSIDGGPSRPYYNETRESRPGAHNLTFWSVDRAGNAGKTGTLWFFVDVNAPDTSIMFDGPGFLAGSTMFVSEDTVISFDAQDEGSGVDYIEYSLDFKGYQRYDRPFKMDKTGAHNLTYRAADRVGNLAPASPERGEPGNSFARLLRMFLQSIGGP
jgi:hypothetical protein